MQQRTKNGWSHGLVFLFGFLPAQGPGLPIAFIFRNKSPAMSGLRLGFTGEEKSNDWDVGPSNEQNSGMTVKVL